MLDLSENKQKALEAEGSLMVQGGPGSGKTTFALLKAQEILKSEKLKPWQTILFLSFARATVARVAEKATEILNTELMRSVEITTYHSFTWTILKSHGYLLNSKSLKIWLPHNAAPCLVQFKDNETKRAEKERRFCEEGLIHFDLFAEKCAFLLERSNALRRVICQAYPVIIIDEFQDTDREEWRLIQQLGKGSRLIALADPDQRIFGFRGAEPARIGQFISLYHPNEFNFGYENKRSNGTDILQFGNDLLGGAKYWKIVSKC